MKKVKVKTTIPIVGGKVVNEFSLNIIEESESHTFEVEYVSPEDGGPLMRPKTPPR